MKARTRALDKIIEQVKHNSSAFLVLYTEEITVDKVLINIIIQKVTAQKVTDSYHSAISSIQKNSD